MRGKCEISGGFPLSEGEVQVWRVDAAAAAGACWHLLLPDELARAREIRRDVARDEFVAGRGVLRLMLGRELNCPAAKVSIGIGMHGKPEADGIDFNVAHSGGVVLIALSRAGAVGIDIEHEDRDVEAVEIARGSFHAEEIEWIERAGTAAFYRCWTRKEAVVKADGRGLSLPLNSFSVFGGDDGGAEVVVEIGADGYQRPLASYHVRDLKLGAGMAAAVALTRRETLVTVLQFVAFGNATGTLSLLKLPGQETILQQVTT